MLNKLIRNYNENMKGFELLLETAKARLKIIVRDEAPKEASILDATGQSQEVIRHLDYFKAVHPQIRKITNQAHRKDEIRTMYQAGFRYNDLKKLSETLESARHTSICMVWKAS